MNIGYSIIQIVAKALLLRKCESGALFIPLHPPHHQCIFGSSAEMRATPDSLGSTKPIIIPGRGPDRSEGIHKCPWILFMENI